jgi:hypothetical protein
MRVHAGNVSSGNQAEELHMTHILDFHAGNVSNENQAKELHMTHKLDESSCRQCQQ